MKSYQLKNQILINFNRKRIKEIISDELNAHYEAIFKDLAIKREDKNDRVLFSSLFYLPDP